MESVSPFERAKALNAQLASLLSELDVDSLPRDQRDVLSVIKHDAIDVRLDIREYGMAETKAEQDIRAHEVRERLAALEQYIVKAGEYNLFGAVDVAQLSAIVQQIISYL